MKSLVIDHALGHAAPRVLLLLPYKFLNMRCLLKSELKFSHHHLLNRLLLRLVLLLAIAKLQVLHKQVSQVQLILLQIATITLFSWSLLLLLKKFNWRIKVTLIKCANALNLLLCHLKLLLKHQLQLIQCHLKFS